MNTKQYKNRFYLGLVVTAYKNKQIYLNDHEQTNLQMKQKVAFVKTSCTH